MIKKMMRIFLVAITGMSTFLSVACYSDGSLRAAEKKHAATVTPKPGASVSIGNAQPILLNSVGVQNVELILRSPSFPGEMTLHISASKGISVLSETEVKYALTENGHYAVPVSLFIEQEGRHYVRLSVQIRGSDASGDNAGEQRVLSAIVQVGAARAPSQKLAPAASDGVISSPAQERVTPRN